jgi:hypothetical protein
VSSKRNWAWITTRGGTGAAGTTTSLWPPWRTSFWEPSESAWQENKPAERHKKKPAQRLPRRQRQTNAANHSSRKRDTLVKLASDSQKAAGDSYSTRAVAALGVTHVTHSVTASHEQLNPV